jgi:CHAT domain
LTQALFDVDPHIVHFSGHGTSAGSICLEDRLGKSHPVSGEALASVFGLFSQRISCVVLNACFSESQADSIAHKVRYVIGMKAAIQDSAAVSFSVGFYRALVNGKNVEEAFQFGTAEVSLSGTEGSSVPLLLTNPQLQERLTLVQERRDPGVGGATCVSVPSIPGRVSIEIGGDGRKPSTYALINPSAYGSIRELLDELFIKALAGRFAPYSYGVEWILSSKYPSRMQAVAPLAWAVGGNQSVLQVSPEWFGTELKEVGILPDSSWEVDQFGWGRKYYGVATNSETLSRALQRHPKAIAMVRGQLKSIPIDELDESKYIFKYVFRDWLDRGPAGRILIEKNPETIDAKLRELRWLR